MIKLPDGELRDYLPATMKNDVDIVCLSYALKKATERLFEYQKSAMTYNIIDNLPEQVLDILAVEMRSVYYLDSMGIETKRKIIKSTLRWYSRAGTLGATKELASVMFGTGGISEWFEYGGRPFYFRPVISIEASQEEVNIFLKYLKLVKNTRSWLDAIVYSAVINHKDLETVILRNVLIRIVIPFWDCDILNGTRFLDGSVLVDARRRYNLVLGIKNGIKFFIKENMDTDRVYLNILSCFNIHEKFCVAGSLYKLGGFGFWFSASGLPVKYELPLKINLPSYVNVKQNIDTACLVNGAIKINTEEKTGAVVDLKASVNFLNGCHQTTGSTGTVTKTRHRLMVKTQMVAENITITYRRNLCYLDGSEKLDGSRLLNAFYRKEKI